MEITPDIREQVKVALKKLDMNGAKLATLIGVNRSWITRFLKPTGGLKTLSNKHKIQLEHHLKISFEDHIGPSLAAHRFDRIKKNIPSLGAAFETTLHELEKVIYTLPQMHMPHILEIGAEATQIVIKETKEGTVPNPYKIGQALCEIVERHLLEQLTEDYDGHDYRHGDE